MIVIECQDCGLTTAEIRNGGDQVFVARLPCKDGCVRDQRQGDQITGATRGDREAIAHLAAIRSEEPGQRS